MPIEPAARRAFASTAVENQQQPFVLDGNTVLFAPALFPERIRMRKKRELDRTKGFCKGEDVVDNGAKNREIHIAGRLRGTELTVFNALLDSGDPFNMTSSTWSGEVYVQNGEVEGPVGYYPKTDSLYWEYALDVVSTGLDEPQETGNGIVSGKDNVSPLETIDENIDTISDELETAVDTGEDILTDFGLLFDEDNGL